MADVLTVKLPHGKDPKLSVDPVNSATATAPGAKLAMIGPPNNGAPNCQGRYVREAAGASGSYRWITDENIAGASPTVFSYVG